MDLPADLTAAIEKFCAAHALQGRFPLESDPDYDDAIDKWRSQKHDWVSAYLADTPEWIVGLGLPTAPVARHEYVASTLEAHDGIQQTTGGSDSIALGYDSAEEIMYLEGFRAAAPSEQIDVASVVFDTDVQDPGALNDAMQAAVTTMVAFGRGASLDDLGLDRSLFTG